MVSLNKTGGKKPAGERFSLQHLGETIVLRSIPPSEELRDMPVMLQRWHAIAKMLSHPHVELTVEEFALVLATFRQLQHAGVEFDPVLAALIGIMERQAFMTGEDAESDNSDPDEDGSDEGLI